MRELLVLWEVKIAGVVSWKLVKGLHQSYL